MPKTAYHVSLKGYVGGWDLDRSDVDAVLAENYGKRVNVLIDSLGGSLATGLSISASSRYHGDVAVHFVELNALMHNLSAGSPSIFSESSQKFLAVRFGDWDIFFTEHYASALHHLYVVKIDNEGTMNTHESPRRKHLLHFSH